MKTVGRRSVVLYLLLAVFFVGLGFFAVRLVLHGGDWAMQPYNGHLYASESSVSLGEIRDRNDNILAYTTQGGYRAYSEDETVRRALLHTVGDPYGNISTGAEYALAGRLSGYNIVTGLNPTFLSGLTKDLRLTVDQEVCAAAYRALGGKNGAVLVYDYLTGDILCKVSSPGFDPMDIPEDLDSNDAYRGAYLDNCLSASFTPGSIFKLVTAAAAMEKWPDSWDSRTYSCEGGEEIGGEEISCLWHNAHGEQNMAQALGNSCNVYFARLAVDIGPDALQKKAEELGFGERFSLEGISCRESSIDLSGCGENQLGWAGVGQYTTLVNPYHMLCLMGAIANGGSAVQPRLTQQVFDGIGGTDKLQLLSGSQAAALKSLMRNDVENYYGDWLFPEGMRVCAKTGTGEVGEEQGPNCWMVGFCDSRESPYAFVVLVEDGAGGIESAGNVAAAVLAELG